MIRTFHREYKTLLVADKVAHAVQGPRTGINVAADQVGPPACSKIYLSDGAYAEPYSRPWVL